MIIGLLFAIFAIFYAYDVFLFSDGTYVALKSYLQYLQAPNNWYPFDVDPHFKRFLPHILVQAWVYGAGLLNPVVSFHAFAQLYAAAYSLTYFGLYAIVILSFQEVKDKYFALFIIGIIQLPVFLIYSYETNFLTGFLLLALALINRRPPSLALMLLAASIILNMLFIHEFYVIAACTLLVAIYLTTQKSQWQQTAVSQSVLAIVIIHSLLGWWQMPAGQYQGQYDQGIVPIILNALQFTPIPLCISAIVAVAYMLWEFAACRRWFDIIIAILLGALWFHLADPKTRIAGFVPYRIIAFFIVCAAVIIYTKFKDKLAEHALIKAVLTGVLLSLIFVSLLIYDMWQERQEITAALDQKTQIKLIDAGADYGAFLPLFSIAFSGQNFCQIAISKTYFNGHLYPQKQAIEKGLRLISDGQNYYPYLFYTTDQPPHIWLQFIDGTLFDIAQLPDYQCAPATLNLLSASAVFK